MKTHIRAGQFNLRGKRRLLLRCRCCEIIDKRDVLRRKWEECERRQKESLFAASNESQPKETP